MGPAYNVHCISAAVTSEPTGTGVFLGSIRVRSGPRCTFVEQPKKALLEKTMRLRDHPRVKRLREVLKFDKSDTQ